MLAQADATAYLLRRSLVTADAVVDGKLTLTDLSRRNHNVRVINDNGPSYLIKQGIGHDGSIGIVREAAAYDLLDRARGATRLRCYLPRRVAYDAAHRLLLLEFIPDAEDLFTYHSRRGRFSTSLAALLGRALSTLHCSGAQILESDAGQEFVGRLPWALFLDRPSLAVFNDISAANLKLIRILQSSPEFRDQLAELRTGWRPETFIHHDIKWDNCLAVAAPDSGRKSRIKIIDWEFANRGDPCWDAGAVFGDYLSFWLTSIPITGEEPAEESLDLARHPIDRMQPAMRAYWRAYARGMKLNASASHEWLWRAVRYSAARLLQTAYEQMQRATHLTGNVVCLLQLSLNILQRPQETITHLLGISPAAAVMP